MPKFYRMLHKPTGLYFCPVRKVRNKEVQYGWRKTNLSQKGKVYTSKPTFGYIGGAFHNHMKPMRTDVRWAKYARNDAFIEEEWEIVEYE